MQAARFYGKGDVRVEEVPIPNCGACEVRLKPVFCGICGTDLFEYLKGATIITTYPNTHSLTGKSTPVILGHELSGIVDTVGSEVADIRPGDHVAVQPVLSDGTCAACRSGNMNRCEQLGFYGLNADGGLAEYMTVPRDRIIPLPEGLPLKSAAIAEPLAVGWHAVRRSGINRSQSALVLGAGPIGLAIVLALKSRGIKVIVSSDLSAARRQAAQDLGARVFNPMEIDIVKACKDLTNAAGVSVAFDAVGLQQTIDQAVAAVQAGGTIVNVAQWNTSASIHPLEFTVKEKHYMGSCAYDDEDFSAVIDALASKTIDPNPLLTKVIALKDIVKEGLVALEKDKSNQIKILISL